MAREQYRQFVLEGMQHQPEMWSNLKGQIYLGDEAFVTQMQKRIGKEKDDLATLKQQKRPIAKPLSEIAAQYKDRKTVIIAAYKTGAYSQREIGEFYLLHPTTIGVIARRNNDSGPDPSVQIPILIKFLGYNPNHNPNSIIEHLLLKHRVLGWSQKEAARILGIDPCTWSSWEGAERLEQQERLRFLISLPNCLHEHYWSSLLSV